MIRRRNQWAGVGASAWSLAIEASSVIALRTLKIARGGPEGAAEAERMVREKVEAAAELQRLAFTGALGVSAAGASAKVVRHYRRKVTANRKRLMR